MKNFEQNLAGLGHLSLLGHSQNRVEHLQMGARAVLKFDLIE